MDHHLDQGIFLWIFIIAILELLDFGGDPHSSSAPVSKAGRKKF